MALSDFTPETVTVKAGKTTIAVHGLSFIDISAIIKTHFDDLDGLFDIYEKHSGADFSNIAMGRYAVGLVKEAPGLVAHIIALAADEPDLVDVAGKLPLLTQVEALQAIGKLTFEEIGGVKKMMENLRDLAAQVRPGAN